ncbi:MAG TPA: NAD(P)/FAD-dependent oxidoreductase [Kofleriaceae bacterium]|nr:NAD(P)/FAD-dependent oxidoreductase [Kofleriaceae bacterium]
MSVSAGPPPGPYDVLVVGGGPAGSTCARLLVAGGARVAVVDRAEFPRVKLCGGWLSPGIWDVLGLAPSSYPRGLWEWKTCHVHYRGRDYAIPCHGWFIRRYELDDYLLRMSGADLHLGVSVKQIERGADGLWSVGGLRARMLVGAGGTHCPVARLLGPARPRRAVGAQELELQVDAAAVARTRVGQDGEPELYLLDDVGGYGWNVPKSDWINVGCGTLDATEARDGWRRTHDHLRVAGHLPAEAAPQLEHMKGHSYFLFEPVHLDAAYRDHAFLIGDSLGLAHPITAEGILPAVLSGRRCAEAILANEPASYPTRLRRDPILADYRRVHAALNLVRKLRDKIPALASLARTAAIAPTELEPEPNGATGNGHPAGSHPADPPSVTPGAALTNATIARGFAWMFSGAKLPAPRLLDFVLGNGE